MTSGAKTDRAQLHRVLDQLAAGDVLMVPRLEQLARSTSAKFSGSLVAASSEPTDPRVHAERVEQAPAPLDHWRRRSRHGFLFSAALKRTFVSRTILIQHAARLLSELA